MAGGHTSWLVGGGILVAGVLAAMPFYRGSQPSIPNAVPVTNSDVQWDGDPLTLRLPGAQPPLRSSASPQRTTVTTKQTPWSSEPPKLEGEYGGLLDRFGEPTMPQQISSERDTRALSIGISTREAAVERGASNSTAAAAAPPAQVARRPSTSGSQSFDGRENDDQGEAPEKTHTIVDGDTLQRIAERYYDDTFYATAIFHRNRHVLEDPELLPVGRTIVIPAPTALEVESQLPLEPLSTPVEQPQTKLEPLR